MNQFHSHFAFVLHHPINAIVSQKQTHTKKSVISINTEKYYNYYCQTIGTGVVLNYLFHITKQDNFNLKSKSKFQSKTKNIKAVDKSTKILLLPENCLYHCVVLKMSVKSSVYHSHGTLFQSFNMFTIS